MTVETKPKKGSHFDLFFKYIFSHLPSAKELFGLVFSKVEMALFDWDQLQMAKDSWQGKRADLVFMVPLTNCGIEDMLSEALSLFDNWTGDKDDLLVNLGNYFWSAVPGMNRELWTKLESLAVKRGIFTKGGYMDIREHIKEEGRQEGMQQKQQQVVLNMLREKADMGFICKVTGLPEEEIKKLKNGS